MKIPMLVKSMKMILRDIIDPIITFIGFIYLKFTFLLFFEVLELNIIQIIRDGFYSNKIFFKSKKNNLHCIVF
ncbi:hypothetical protein WKT22_00831 [Candidatus Lokiarchaeum ossiferum]